MSNIIAITGGASGIGRGTAERFLADGWTVLALDVVQASLDTLKREIGAHPTLGAQKDRLRRSQPLVHLWSPALAREP